MHPFLVKRKRPLIVALVLVELVLAMMFLSTGPVAVVRADFGVPIDSDCSVSTVQLLGLNDVDGAAVSWATPASGTFEVPTGDVVTGINITVLTASTLIDAYNKVACDVRLLDPSDHELLNETVRSMAWVKSGYFDGSMWVTYLELEDLDVLLGDVGVYQLLIVAYYLE